MESPTLWLHNICRKNGLQPTDHQLELLEHFVVFLLEWNRKVNLISRQDENLVWQNHILHSISPLFKLTLKAKPVVMDLGTGGGLPGIPLKILLPESEFMLVDSTKKKVNALQDIVGRLSLRGVSALWCRAEDLVKEQNLLLHFDYIVARGVAPLNDLIAWSRPFLKPASLELDEGGQAQVRPPALIALKGGELEDEIAKAKSRSKTRSIEVVDLVFPGSEEFSGPGKKVVIVHF